MSIIALQGEGRGEKGRVHVYERTNAPFSFLFLCFAPVFTFAFLYFLGIVGARRVTCKYYLQHIIIYLLVGRKILCARALRRSWASLFASFALALARYIISKCETTRGETLPSKRLGFSKMLC